MSKPHRIISIRIPHGEPLVAALLIFLLVAGARVLTLGPYLPSPWPAEEAAPASVPAPNAQLADRALNERVENLLGAMTLEQKIGQLTQYSAGTMTGPGTGRSDYDDQIVRGEIGSLFNEVGARLTNRYQRLPVVKRALHIPLLFGYDVID